MSILVWVVVWTISFIHGYVFCLLRHVERYRRIRVYCPKCDRFLHLPTLTSPK